MMGLFENSTSIVEQAEETEQQLIERARLADSDSAWTVGECASLWTQKYARGRTDAEFAKLIGMDRARVQQRRQVYERFGDVRSCNSSCNFTHFRTAAAWPDAEEFLGWADENEATVEQMKAYRRAVRGEDLTVDADDDGQAEGHEDAAAEPHVGDVDPHQKPPSNVVNTPPDFPESATPVLETAAASSASGSPSVTDVPPSVPPSPFNPEPVTPEKPAKAKPVEQKSFTLAELRKLLKAVEDTTGDVRESRKLAAWHRKRADELDPQTSKAKPGSVEEVAEYARELGGPFNAQKWWDHYSANGWKVGQNPMRDWRASVRNADWCRESDDTTGSLTDSLDRFVERMEHDDAS